MSNSEPMHPARFDVFLSHNSHEKPAVRRIAEKLKAVGLEPWLDEWYLTIGRPWQEELADALRACSACAVCIGAAGLGNWVREEMAVALDRAAKDRSFRIFLVLLPGLAEPFDAASLPAFLTTRTWVDLRRGLDDARTLQSLINAVKGIPFGPPAPLEVRNETCPYLGLKPFEAEHAQFFFGRDADIQRLIEKLKTARFLAVLGASGSGKSSLVRAGLIPALRAAALPGSDGWTIRAFVPGAHPLTALAAQLLALAPQGQMTQLLDQLRADARTMDLAIAVALVDHPSTERIVWVVDQFEEVFSLCREEAERASFLANLMHTASLADGRNAVVLTMRADFYPKCATYPPLAALIASSQYLVSPLQSAGLKQAIEEPAHLVGLEFEPGLIDTILDDVERQPGALPLLEHALLELWHERRGSMLTLEAYRGSGGVAGAIAKRAETIFETFDAAEQLVARRILLRLTQPGEGTEDTRRRATMDELASTQQQRATTERVVQALTAARLLTLSTD